MDTHADTRKNIFLLRKNADAFSLFHFSFPFIPGDSSQPFTPRRHFHFIHSLSHHAPSFLLSPLTPFPPFLLILFLLLFPSALGESALVVLHSLSLPPTFCPLSLCLCHHLCVRNQMKLLLSAATRMQAVSCPR